jgi:hypothetical protein
VTTLATMAIVAFVAVLLTGGASGAGCTKTWNGGSGSWETASDWTPTGVPGGGDDVCINATGTYAVTLSGNNSIAALTVGGASGAQTLLIQPNSSLNVGGDAQIETSGAVTLENATSSTTRLDMTSASGALANAGTLTLGAAALSSSLDLYGNVTSTGTIADNSSAAYAHGTLDNKGTLKIASGVALEDDNTTILDDTGGSIEAAGSGKLFTSGDSAVYEQGNGTTSGANPIAIENGALIYSGSGKSTILATASFSLQGSLAQGQSLTVRGQTAATASTSFTNAGTITLDGKGGDPVLRISSGTLSNTGTIATESSDSSSHEPEIAGNLTNEGTLAADVDSVYSTGTLDNKGAIKIANGVTFDDSDTTVDDDTGGSIAATGNGKLTSTDDFAAYEQGEGTTSGAEPVVLDGAALKYTGHGASDVIEVASFSLQGDLAGDQSLTVRGQSSAKATASFTNAGTITLDATTGDPVLHVSGGTFTNSGMLVTEASATPHEAEINGEVTNSGVMSIDVDTAYSGSSVAFDNKGAVNIADGVTLNEDQNFFDDAGGSLNATGDGVMLVDSDNGVYDQGDGTTSGSEPVLLDGAALDYTGDGQDAITVEDGLNVQGDLSAGQSLTLIDNARLNAAESFLNAGEIALDSTHGAPIVHLATGKTLQNSGTFLTRSAGSVPHEWEVINGAFANTATGSVQAQVSSDFEGLTNAGSVLVGEGATLKARSFQQTAGSATLSGTAAHPAELAAPTVALEGGALEGDGTIAGNLLNEATVAPGKPAPGTIAVEGAYTQSASGKLAVEVLKTGADALTATGAATLSGTLALATTGAHPSAGATYTPLSASSRSGEFTTVNGLESGPYEARYTSSGVELLTLSSALPTLSVQGETLRNPDSGDGVATFTVKLSSTAKQPVSVSYATVDGVAKAPGDYEAASGELTFAAGETQKTIPVTVHGTSEPTPERTFYLDLSAPSGATIEQGRGAATVENDHLAATRVTPVEGGQGGAVTLTIEGAGFTGTPTVTLEQAGQPNIVAGDVKADSAADALSATFDLSQAAEGAYDVVVTLPKFSVSSTLPAAFKVTAPWAAEIESELVGFPAGSTHEPWTGELLYTNTGTLDAHNTILAIEGFQTGAEVKVSGPNVLGTTYQDNGSSRTVLIEISEVPAQSTEAAFVTFTPVGDNGSVYSLQPFTVVSNDETFAPPTSDPTVTAKDEVTSESKTSVTGVIHVSSATGGGDVRYSIEAGEKPASEAPSSPRVSETTLPNGETQDELEATLPGPATGPPPFSPSDLLSPGPFSVCSAISREAAVVRREATSLASTSFEVGTLASDGCLSVAEFGEGGEEGGEEEGGEEGEGDARAPGLLAHAERGARGALTVGSALRAHPQSAGGTVSTIKTIIKSGKTIKEKWESIQKIKEEVAKAKHNEATERHMIECLKEHGWLGAGQAETALNVAEGASSLAQFEALANEVGFSKAVEGATSPKALELFNSVVQSAWGEQLFGGGLGGNTGALTGTNSSGPFAGLNTPAERLQKALELCPPEPEEPEPKKEPEPKPKPKPKHKKGGKKRHPPHRLKVRNSHDPNELVGPEGYGAGNYIAPEGPLTYEALFTNDAKAGAAAREVRVTDQLESSKVDLATFSFGPIFFGGAVAAPAPGLQKWNDTVTLAPSGSRHKELLVRIEAELNRQTGLVTWNLQAIDPATGQPPQDPSDGFLPPNVTPPEGVGGASFTVQPNAGLQTGEVIADGATIVFDQNAPIKTVPWLNTIDTSTPSSHVASVDQARAGGDCADLSLAWTGSDTGAGIDHYEIYVSKNGGPLEIWRPMTAATSAIFPGVAGSSYSFSSVATDGVLHSETPPSTPSASVTAACAAASGPGAPPGSSTTGAHISHLAFSPAKFAVGKAATAVSAHARERRTAGASARKHRSIGKPHAPIGSTISYTLSGAGDVSIAIERQQAGLKLEGEGCVVASASARRKLLAAAVRRLGRHLSAAQRKRRLAALIRAARCTALHTEGKLERASRAGVDRVDFSGRIGPRALKPGDYLAKATIGSAATASSASTSFQIVPAHSGGR